MDMYKVSIIIPVYNVEKYLEECLRSVCNQTLKEIEIICVDDGSTDASAEILDSWGREDERIKVVHKGNEGYGKAMNIGMQMADGEYIGIVEPDDFIDLRMMECLYEIAQSQNAEVVKSDFWTIRGEGTHREILYNKLVSYVDMYEKIVNPIEDINVFWGHVGNWTGIYRRDFILTNEIKHNETPGASFQDQGFWFQVFALAHRVYILPKAFYYYRQDNPNASMLSKQKVFCIADEYKYIYNVLGKNFKRFKTLLPIYIRCKYAAYLFNYNRIEERSKINFLQYFAEEFNQHEKQDELDLRYFSAIDRRRVHALMDSPETFPQIPADDVKEFNAMLENKKIVIYGAGKVAEQVWSAFTDKNRESVCGVWVTNVLENENEFHGIPVTDARTASLKNAKDRIVVIAVGHRYIDDVIQVLHENRIENYIVVKDYL